jgi:cytochrome d ubiquinol oxidase subunit II
MIDKMQEQPWLFSLPALAFLSIFNVPRLMHHKREGWAFIFSCLSIAFLLSLFAIGTYPVMIRSSVYPDSHSLLVQNSASSPLTLKILLIIVAVGLPLVFSYGYYIYRIFRGKVRIEKHSY